MKHFLLTGKQMVVQIIMEMPLTDDDHEALRKIVPLSSLSDEEQFWKVITLTPRDFNLMRVV